MSDLSSLQQQLIAVQETVMHLQHEFEQLHQVVLAQQQEVTLLRREIRSVKDVLENLEEGAPFPSPSEDRPPHY